MTTKPKVVIAGGGPAGLMAAYQLKDNADVTIVDHKRAVGRKFLVAGDGGFNLTHSEPLETFLQKYDSEFIRNCVKQFTPEDTRQWLKEIGVDTFIGSSGKVFPVEGTKPVSVLNAIIKPLKKSGVKFITETEFLDFTDKSVLLSSASGSLELDYDFLILAMGGASWKKTGSTGKWLDILEKHTIPVLPFQSSNSGVELTDISFLTDFEGSQIKNVRVKFGTETVSGDLTITTYGLEGKPVYASNNWLRNNEFLGLEIDFKPQLSEKDIYDKLKASSNVRKGLQQLKVPDSVYNWLKASLTKEEFIDRELLARKIKTFNPKIKGLRPVDEVISVVGGVSLEAIDNDGRLKQFSNIYCCGEMLNWDAPTGGYLLQACFSSGYRVGEHLRQMLNA